MYTCWPSRLDAETFSLFNKIYQIRGGAWRSSVLDGVAFPPEVVANNYEWISKFAESVFFLTEPRQMDCLMDALRTSTLPEDRAFLICASIEAQINHRCRAEVPDAYIDELFQYITQAPISYKTHFQYCRFAIQILLVTNRAEAARDIVTQSSRLMSKAVTDEDVKKAINLIGWIFYLETKHKVKITSFVTPDNSAFSFFRSLAFASRDTKAYVSSVDEWWQRVEPEIEAKIQSLTVEPDIPALMQRYLIKWFVRGDGLFSQRLFLETILDGTTLSSVPYWLQRLHNIDPDVVLDELRMNGSDDQDLTLRLGDIVNYFLEVKAGRISSLDLFLLINNDI